MPFFSMDGTTEDPPVSLLQVGAKHFKLLVPLKFVDSKTGAEHVIPAHDPADRDDTTDLASVPPFMWWFIASYGHQTRAALLHDHLVQGPSEQRREADRIFRDALQDSKVGEPRSWIMWTAVALLTLLKTNKLLFVLMCVQIALGLVALAFGVGDLVGLWEAPLPWWIWVIAPLGTSVLWGSRSAIASIGTYAGFWLFIPTVVVLITIFFSALVSVIFGGEFTLTPYRRADF